MCGGSDMEGAPAVLKKRGGRRGEGRKSGDRFEMNKTQTDYCSSEESYARIFNNSEIGIFRCTAEGLYVTANPAYARIHGFDSAEELMTAAAALDGPAYVNAADSAKFKECLHSGENIEGFEAERYRRDGGRIWVSISAWPVGNSEGGPEFYEGTCVDITKRMLAEEELRASRERYQSLVEWSSVLIWEVDLRGVVTYINSTPPVLRGYRPEDVIGKPFSDFLLPEDEAKISEFWKRLYETGKESWDIYEIQVRIGSGEPRWLMTTGEFMRDENGGIVGRRGMGIDVTERKLMEIALKQSENMYRTMFENAGTATILYDEDTTVIQNANPAMEELTGYSGEELEGLSWGRLVLPDDLERMLRYNRIRKISPEAVPRRYEFRLATRHQGVRDILITVDRIPGTTKKVASLLDITETKRAGELIEENLRFLQSLIDAIPNPIFYKGLDGRHLGCNGAFAEALGRTREEIIGRTTYGLHPGDLADSYLRMDEQLLKKPGVQVWESVMQYADGSRRDVIFTKATFEDRRGVLAGLIGVILDITERKQAEEALRMSDTRLRQVIDLVPHFIFAKDREGRFVLANKAVADAYGTTVEDLTGRRDSDFNSDADEVAHFLEDDLLVMDSGVRKEIPEETLTDSQGNVRLVQTTKIPFTLSMTGSDAVLGVSTDITERKRAEKAIRDSEEKYRNIFENAVEGIFQSIPEGRFLSVNPALAKMFGYESPQALIETITDTDRQMYVLPEDCMRFRKLIEDEGHVEAFEARMYRRDGGTLWVSVAARAIYDEEGSLVCVEGTTEDITKRKRDEDALQESEAKYRSVVENSLVAVYIAQNGLFRFVNAPFRTLLGYTLSEVIDRLGPMDLVHSDDRERVARNTMKMASGEAGFVEHEFKAVRKDGKVITVKAMESGLYYHGTPASTGILMDITRERTLEAQLRQAQKVEAIGHLAGGVAHDFNNILTVMTGYASLLDMKMDGDDPLREHVTQILSASKKASGLTQSLLTFSRQRSVTLLAVDINGIVRGTIGLLKRLITEDIVLNASLKPDAITIMADATQIDQILFNLVTNAVDAMKKGGTITIETELAELDEFPETHGFGKPGVYAVLSVTDTGEGMDEATREKIFDPFFTTKEVGKGTGLGLSTVYGIVRQHGGYISVASEPDAGTSFRIYFPALDKKIMDKDEPAPGGLRGGKETILVAEDDESVRRFLVEVLGLYGYRVVQALDGEDAVRKFAVNDDIDLTILDSVMPNKNGREAYDDIVRMRPGTRVLFISGYTKDVVLDKGVIEKEFAFISKPLSPNDLLRAVREVLDG